MHESPGLNPDWLWEINSFSEKNSEHFVITYPVLVFHHKQAAMKLDDSFQLAVCFFMNCDNISFFSFDGKFIAVNAWFENKF